VFSPYQPWEEAPDAQPSSPALNNLAVLQTDVDFDALLQPAALADLQRGMDGMDESEGAETWPAPAEAAQPAPRCSLSSQPPSSPGLPGINLPRPFPTPKPAPKGSPGSPPNQATAAAMPSPSEPLSARRLKQREGKKARQACKRQQETPDPLWAKVKPALSRIWQKPMACKVAYSVSLLPGTEGGFTGRRLRLEPRLELHDHALPWTLQELKERGFWLVEWDGRCAMRPRCFLIFLNPRQSALCHH
jgi:hypothetical protein